MISNQTGSFRLMKSLNRSLILNTIRRHEAVSRAEIAKETKLTPPTITNLVSELIEENLVYESSSGASRGGRRPILLKIKSESRFIIGVDIGVRKMRIALSDLDAVISHRVVINMPPALTGESFLLFVTSALGQFLEGIGEKQEKLIGVGIAMHGIIDSRTGVSIHAPTLGLTNVPVKKRLEQELQLPVEVANDAKAMALAEKWFGAGRHYEDFLCLNIGEGMGSGLILQNALYHGSGSLAGELGHIVLSLEGERCSCGAKGCLQTFVSGEAIQRRTLARLHAGEESTLQQLTAANGIIDGAAVFAHAEKGDRLSISILKETGTYLGLGLTSAIHLLNPPLIILGGGVAKAADYLLPAVREVWKERALTAATAETEVKVSQLGSEGTLMGACTLILSQLFQPEN